MSVSIIYWVIGVIFVFLVFRLLHAVTVFINQKTVNSIMNDNDYDEVQIIAHLDYIIDEAIDSYLLLNISMRDIFNINSNLENEMRDELMNSIPERISNLLYNRLCRVYNKDYVGKFLGEHIYFKISQAVSDYNNRMAQTFASKV